MSGVRSPEYDLLLNALTHEWVDVEDLMQDLIPKVAPGRAKRFYDSTDETTRQRTKATRVKTITEQEQIRSGARALINRAITSASNAGLVQKTSSELSRQVRKNVFDADYIDKLVASLVKANKETKEPEPPLQPLPVPVISDPIFDLSFDHRNIRQGLEIKGRQNSDIVSITIFNVTDKANLRLFFTPRAADWLYNELLVHTVVAQSSSK